MSAALCCSQASCDRRLCLIGTRRESKAVISSSGIRARDHRACSIASPIGELDRAIRLDGDAGAL
jgi:hypothetical protein